MKTIIYQNTNVNTEAIVYKTAGLQGTVYIVKLSIKDQGSRVDSRYTEALAIALADKLVEEAGSQMY